MRSIFLLFLEEEKGQEGMKQLARIKVWIDERERRMPVDYVRCQWQTTSKSAMWFLYRLVVALWFLEALLYSTIAEPYKFPYWLLYFTHWSFLTASIQACLAFILVAMNQADKFSPGGGKHQDRVCKAYEWIYSSATVQALTVSLIYWTLIFNPHNKESMKPLYLFGTVQVHAFNTIFMLLDLALVAFPLRVVNIILPMTITAIYIIFNAIYCLSGGTTANGDHYIYKVMDWGKPAITVPLVLGSIIFIPLVHMFVWWLSHSRRKIAARQEKKRIDQKFAQSAAHP